MTNSDSKSHALGGRLPILLPNEMTPEQRVLHEQMKGRAVPWARSSGFIVATEGGILIGPFNAYLYNPALGTALQEMLKTERATSSLSTLLREVVILTVGAVWRSSYELYAHCAVAKSLGMSDRDIEALVAGNPPQDIGQEGLTAQRFVLAMAKDHKAPEALYEEAVALFGHRGLIDMIHLAGMYMTVSSLLNAFEVPVPAATSCHAASR